MLLLNSTPLLQTHLGMYLIFDTMLHVPLRVQATESATGITASHELASQLLATGSAVVLH